MQIQKASVCASVLALWTAPFACAQSEDIPAMFSDAAELVETDAIDDPSIVRQRTVFLATSPTELSENEAFKFNLFEDIAVSVVLDKGQQRFPHEFWGLPVEPIGIAWTGTVIDERSGSLVLIADEENLRGWIHIEGLATFRIDPVSDEWFSGLHVIREFGTSAGFECGADWLEPVESSGGGEELLPDPPTCPGSASACDDGNRIDIILLYTPQARIAAAEEWQLDPSDHTAILWEIDEGIRSANRIYFDSQIPTELRAVYVGEAANYVQQGFPNDLANIGGLWDGYMDDVHPMRNALRADLVGLVADNTTSSSHVMAGLDPNFESLAFAVIGWSGAGGPTFTLAHEFCHIMGCWHDRIEVNAWMDCAAHVGAFNYSWGCHFPLDCVSNPTGAVYKDIMAQPFGVSTLVPRLSNPLVEYDGYATGVAAPSCCSADNALTITNTRETVARFRKSDDTTNTTIRASFSHFGCGGTSQSLNPSISSSGQWVAFESDVEDLWADQNQNRDVFLYNRESMNIRPVSGRQVLGNGPSFDGAISGNGHYVAFSTDATNLELPAAQDGNFSTDILARDMEGAGIKRVNLSDFGNEADDDSFNPSISSSGRYIVFESDATNLVPGDTLDLRDIFVRDRDKDLNRVFDEPNPTTPPAVVNVSTTRVSFGGNGLSQANDNSYNAVISGDGNWIAFESLATNLLTTSDSNGKRDIFVRHRTGGATTRVSVGMSAESNGDSFSPSISQTGRYITFASDATNLVDSDNNLVRDIFVYDRDTNTTVLVSRANGATGAQGDAASDDPSISGDGKRVSFTSAATNFESPSNGFSDVFVRDLPSNTTTRVSIADGVTGTAGNQSSLASAISYDGRFVAFQSDASNLTSNDNNTVTDVFLRDRGLMLVGDLSGDYRITSLDQNILIQNWTGEGETCDCCAADLDRDGDVDVDDLIIQINNWTG